MLEKKGHPYITEHSWMFVLADTLVREIFQQLSAIELIRRERPPAEAARFLTTRIRVDDAYHTELSFFAERALLERMVCNMQCAPAESEEELAEYEKEFLNIFCGRFLTEVRRITGKPGRFFPPRYEGERSVKAAVGTMPANSIYYQSDKGERAQFHWSAGMT